MIELTIDGHKMEVREQATVLDVAEQAGIKIPTLCHKPGYEHFTSCMVCMVEDELSGKLLPACSALVQDGMRINTHSERARKSRKSALELMLSEHVGDCDAPCYTVCKAGIDIPLMIRKIAAGQIDAAATVVRRATQGADDPCAECSGRCEKACRRRQHDEAVAIRDLIKYVIGHGTAQSTAGDDRPDRKAFNSNMGRLQNGEMEEFLRRASAAARIEPAAGQDQGFSLQEAMDESQRCFHCDCRKRESCRLRTYSTEYDARQRHYAVAERMPFRQIGQESGIVYEPGKCIKCGICVRITARRKEDLGLTFIGRGFQVEVGVPFGESLRSALKKTGTECVVNCPTAALAFDDDTMHTESE